MDIKKFNERFKLRVTDVVGDFFGRKHYYHFDSWGEVQFFLPFGYSEGKRQIEVTEAIFTPDGVQVSNLTKVKVYDIGELTFLEQVNNVLGLFGEELVISDKTEQFGILLIDLPSRFMKYTYVARRTILGDTYYTVMNSDDISFIASEGSRAVFTEEEVENDPILRRYYFKKLNNLQYY